MSRFACCCRPVAPPPAFCCPTAAAPRANRGRLGFSFQVSGSFFFLFLARGLRRRSMAISGSGRRGRTLVVSALLQGHRSHSRCGCGATPNPPRRTIPARNWQNPQINFGSENSPAKRRPRSAAQKPAPHLGQQLLCTRMTPRWVRAYLLLQQRAPVIV